MALGMLASLVLAFHVSTGPASAGMSKDEIANAKAELDLRIHQATADALLQQRAAEARKATAEAERAELLARLPPASSQPLAGEVGVKQFGAAGLVRALDLAHELAGEVCAVLPAGGQTVVYDPQVAQGIVAARMVSEGITHLTEGLAQQNKELQAIIDRHTPKGTQVTTLSAVSLAAVPAVVRAVADITALFKTDVTASGLAYGDGAREMFITALAARCPDRLAAPGSGYLGELDPAQHGRLLARVRTLARLRGEFANRIALVQQLAELAKPPERRQLSQVATAAGALVKEVDAFIESLQVGEAGDRSPLYNAARYLGFANRVAGARVLEFDLRLEGMTIVKDGLFTGQRLRLSGVAFLWYRLYEADGRLLRADTVRRLASPTTLKLR